MLDQLIGYLEFEFIKNALAAGILIAIPCGIIGTLVVVNRLVFMSEGIAHSAFGGIGIAIYLGITPFLGGLAFSLSMAAFLAIITLNRQQRSDTLIGVLMAFSMALGIIFLDMTPGYRAEPLTYLFGSILTVTRPDLYWLIGFNLLLVSLTVLFYRNILAVSHDYEFARTRGIAAPVYYIAIMVITALSVIMMVRITGLILLVAMLTIPASMAEKYCKSLAGTMFLATIITAVITQLGLITSVVYNITGGAAVVLTATAAFTLETLIRKAFYLDKKTQTV